MFVCDSPVCCQMHALLRLSLPRVDGFVALFINLLAENFKDIKCFHIALRNNFCSSFDTFSSLVRKKAFGAVFCWGHLGQLAVEHYR